MRFDRRHGRLGYEIADTKTSRATLAAPALTGDLDSLANRLETILTREGLYRREAQAMVDTWRDSWFEEGTRLLYIVPRATVDAMLPLDIRPRPVETARVFVGRLELITPATTAEVKQALETRDPLTIKAFQYDIVCNGVELSSGAIRNHLPQIMYKAFAIAGYSAAEVESRFGGMLNAFKYGAPPHGGSAPGIDRIVMLLADEKNIREVVAFPMNQRAEDLLMQAPTEVPPARLKELCIKLDLPPAKK